MFQINSSTSFESPTIFLNSLSKKERVKVRKRLKSGTPIEFEGNQSGTKTIIGWNPDKKGYFYFKEPSQTLNNNLSNGFGVIRFIGIPHQIIYFNGDGINGWCEPPEKLLNKHEIRKEKMGFQGLFPKISMDSMSEIKLHHIVVPIEPNSFSGVNIKDVKNLNQEIQDRYLQLCGSIKPHKLVVDELISIFNESHRKEMTPEEMGEKIRHFQTRYFRGSILNIDSIVRKIKSKQPNYSIGLFDLLVSILLRYLSTLFGEHNYNSELRIVFSLNGYELPVIYHGSNGTYTKDLPEQVFGVWVGDDKYLPPNSKLIKTCSTYN
jgi:hypothetical protein